MTTNTGLAEKIWHNGNFINWEDANIHVMSHVVHYGTAVFEGIRCYKNKKGSAIFRLPEHIKRLFNSAKIYRMIPPDFTYDQLYQACITGDRAPFHPHGQSALFASQRLGNACQAPPRDLYRRAAALRRELFGTDEPVILPDDFPRTVPLPKWAE